MPRPIDNDSRIAFEQKLFELFPEVKKTGRVTRTQLKKVMKVLKSNSEPMWIKKNRIGWGEYSITVTPKLEDTPKPEEEPVDIIENIVEGSTKVKNETTISSVEVDLENVRKMVPPRDRNYVAWGNFNDIEQIVKSGEFFPVFITGQTRNGKTAMVEQIHAKQKKPLIRVNIRASSDEDKLIGSKTLIDGTIQVTYGPVLICMKAGVSILMDEYDAGQANELMCLQPILEGKPYYFALKNEWVYPQPGFNIYATGNTKGKGSDDGRYIGTNILNEANLERFAATFEQNYPPPKIESKIVKNYMIQYHCTDEVFCDNLVRWADIIRKTFDEGAISETITTGRLIHIVRSYSVFKDKKKALEICLNRFDSQTKAAFLSTYEKVSTEPAGIEDVDTTAVTEDDVEPIPF